MSAQTATTSQPPPKPETRGFNDIGVNLLFSVPVGLGFFFFLCYARKIFSSMYTANILRNPAIKHGGRFGWLRTVWSIDDAMLLTLAGLDGFLGVQVFKMICMMLVVLALPTLCFLMPLYYLTSVRDTGDDRTTFGQHLFYNLSILVLPQNLLWIPMLTCYMTTGISFYFVYSFCRAYLLQRQSYLIDAATMTGFVRMRRMVDAFGGDIEAARAYANSVHRAIVLSGVSARYSEAHLRELLETGLGPVETAHYLHSREKLRQALDSCADYLVKLEQAYEDFYTGLLRYVRQVLAAEEDADELMHRFEEALARASPIALDERCRLMQTVHDAAFMVQCRPKHLHSPMDTKRHRHAHNVSTITADEGDLDEHGSARMEDAEPAAVVKDAITYFHHAVLAKDRRYEARLAEFVAETDEDIAIERARTDSEDLENAGKEGAGVESVDSNAVRQRQYSRTMLTYKSLGAVWKNLKDFKLTLWGTSRSAVVVFRERETATIASQVVLSRRPFSMHAVAAPAADDLLWSNLYLPPADRALRRIAGEILYLCLNVFFSLTAATISSLLQLEELEKLLPFIKPVIDFTPSFRVVIRGILAPLGLALSYLIVPYALNSIGMYQGRTSKTGIEGWVVGRYAWFLFIQLFVIGFFPGQNVLQIIHSWISGDLREHLGTMQANLPSKSVFFINSTIQKTFITMSMAAAKPTALVLHWLYNVDGRARSRLFPPSRPVYFRIIFTEQCVFVFLMCMAFMIVTPIFLPFGILFFATAYYVMRHNMIFSDIVVHESGGIYWQTISQHILAGITMAQVFLLFQLIVDRRILESIMMMPLIVGTFFGILFVQRIFREKLRNAPQTREDEDAVQALLADIGRRQRDLLAQDPDEAAIGGDKAVSRPVDVVPIKFASSASICDADPAQAANPYVNPLLLKRSQCIVLPPAFLPLIRWLLEHPTVSLAAVERYCSEEGVE